MKTLPRWHPAIIALLLLGIAFGLRWSSFSHGLWNVDEAIHAAVASILMDGGVLYRDAADIRHPLTYYVFAGIFELFGANALWAVRALAAILIGLTGWFLFKSGRAVHGMTCGLIAGVTYVLLATAALHQGDANAAHTEWFVAFFSSAAIAVFLGRATSFSSLRLMVSGLLFSGAFLSKQPALLDAAAPVASVAWLALHHNLSLSKALKSIGWLLIGWSIPVLLTLLFFATKGALGSAIFYTWIYNLTYYGPEIATAERVIAAGSLLQMLLKSSPGLFLLWAAMMVLSIYRLLQRSPNATEARLNPSLACILIWSIAGIAGAAASGRSFDHYLIQLLAPFSLGMALGAALLISGTAAWNRLLSWSVMLGMLGLIAHLGIKSVLATSRALPDDPSVPIADYIRDHSAEDDRIFVWGFQPDIYVQSNRRPASRYVIASFVTGLIPWTNVAPGKDTRYASVPGSMENLLKDLSRNQPRFIVDCSQGPNRHWDKYPPDNYPRFHTYLETHYDQVSPERFIPMGFRLYQRRTSANAENTLAHGLTADTLRELNMAQLASPLIPDSAHAPYGASRDLINGRIQLFLHAPSDLSYRLPEGSSGLRGGFGIRPPAYAPDNKGPTDGAEFVVRWQPYGKAPAVLFRRLLQPLGNSADRGEHDFYVVIPNPHQGGLLTLEINPGPAGNNASDWTYWSNLILENSH